MFGSRPGPPILTAEIRAHCEMIHTLAAPLAGKGKLVIAGFGEDPDKPHPKTNNPGCPLPPCVVHVGIGDTESTIRTVADLTVSKHRNVYMPLAVFRSDLQKGRKGFEKDIVAVLGLVADFDDTDAARWAERLPLPPNFVLETSAGRFQAFYLFDKPEAFAAVKPIAARLKAYAGCDYGTADLSHVWRIGGTLNWPNAKKVGAGRPREPQTVRVAKQWDGTTISLDALAAALPASNGKASAQKQEDQGATRGDGLLTENAPAEGPAGSEEVDTTAGRDPGLPVETIVGLLPPKLRERIISAPAGDRSRDLFYVIRGLISRNLDDTTIERIIRNYPAGIGSKYAERSDLDREIRRIRKRSSKREEAERDAAQTRGTGRPIVRVVGGALPAIVDSAEILLLESDNGLYEFADQIVRPAIEPIQIAGGGTVPGLRLIPVGINYLIERFTRFIDFQRFDARTGELVSIDCPKKVAATYLERAGVWRLPKLVAITTCPILRPDGTVLYQPGFDDQTGILFDPRGVDYPQVPEAPTRDDALLALAELKSLISEFPFVDGPSRSVALSGLLTSVSRLALATAPMHAFDAPAAGTGKSKLADCCTVIATGHECPVISQGSDEVETEKRLGAALIAGDRMISIDNCENPLGGQLICQLLTQRLVKVRVLGLSKLVTILNLALYFATGNNLPLVGDVTRRTIVGRLDAGIERPELREFSTEDPVKTLKRDRPKYVVACLTILRAYIVAGAPEQTRPLGGFEDWSRLVRDALVWLEEADPVDTMERTRGEDPQRASLVAILPQWRGLLGRERVSVKEVIDKATDFDASQGGVDFNRRPFLHPEFREALLAIAGDRGSISGRRLGKWLSANKGKVFDGLRIVRDGILDGVARYRLQSFDGERWE